MTTIVTHNVTEDEGDLRLDKWFHHKVQDMPYSLVQRLCRSGQVRLNGGRVKSNHRLRPGDTIRYPHFSTKPEPQTSPKTPSPRQFTPSQAFIASLAESIVHVGKDYIVINKPQGLAVQGGTGISACLDGALPDLVAYLNQHHREFQGKNALTRLYLTHRLDRDTSGLLLLATSSLGAKRVAEAFKKRQITKVYLAICDKRPRLDAGRHLVHLKEARRGHEKIMAIEEGRREGKIAQTAYTVLDHAGEYYSLLRLEPLTGRTHQLRVACKDLGCPIIGDTKYNPAYAPSSAGEGEGKSTSKASPRRRSPLMLHAWKLAWPEGGLCSKLGTDLCAPPPEPFLSKMNALGLQFSP